MDKITHKVYVKTDENGFITAINSSIFLADLTGWIEIDEGIGDKYAHAQGNYFKKPLSEISSGAYNYRLIDGKVVEIPEDEKVYIEPAKYIDPLSQVRADLDYIAIMTGVEL